ncbi:MAG: hypothetical protein JEZ07_12905 [Phycisphaerae bacterium]|nr:hypothetical protein [Phycisphaerae bacterium]
MPEKTRFYSLPSFILKNGRKLSDSVYERLLFDIEEGKGKSISVKNCYVIRAGLGGCNGLAENGWMVLYIRYPDYRTVFLMDRIRQKEYQEPASEELTDFKKRKKKLDKAFKDYAKRKYGY